MRKRLAQRLDQLDVPGAQPGLKPDLAPLPVARLNAQRGVFRTNVVQVNRSATWLRANGMKVIMRGLNAAFKLVPIEALPAPCPQADE